MTRVRADGHSGTIVLRVRRRRYALAVIALLAFALLAGWLRVSDARAAELAPAPDFALKSTGGANHRLSEYRGDVVVLAFGASWCGSCRESAAQLERIQAALGPRGLQVLAVHFDSGAAAAPRAAFPVLIDPSGETGPLYGVDDLPLVILMDREGRVRQRFPAGQPPAEQALRAALEPLLAE